MTYPGVSAAGNKDSICTSWQATIVPLPDDHQEADIWESTTMKYTNKVGFAIGTGRCGTLYGFKQIFPYSNKIPEAGKQDFSGKAALNIELADHNFTKNSIRIFISDFLWEAEPENIIRKISDTSSIFRLKFINPMKIIVFFRRRFRSFSTGLSVE